MDSLIIEAINKIRSEVKKKPNTERIYNLLKKNDEQLSIDEFKDSLRKLEAENVIYCKGEGEEESFFISKTCNVALSEDLPNPDIDIDTSTTDYIDQMYNKCKTDAESSDSRITDILICYESLVKQLRSENEFLRKIIMSAENSSKDEISFLRHELNQKTAKLR